MKQLTGNPSPASRDHGLTLLGLMLSTFPPSAELENFLEMFLRDLREKDLIAKLHLIVYGAPVPGIPALAQVAVHSTKHGVARRCNGHCGGGGPSFRQQWPCCCVVR